MWKDIDGFDGMYQINEKGEVYSHKRRKILKKHHRYSWLLYNLFECTWRQNSSKANT